jgi:hypothetical protein
MLNRERLRQQLMKDYDRLQDLVLRYASWEGVKQELQQLEGAVQVKMARGSLGSAR